MIILGLYIGHNASACVIKDGELLINWELERFTRVKHDFGYNAKFIEKTLEHCGLTWLDVDIVACNNPKTITQWREKNNMENPPFDIPTTGGVEYKEFPISKYTKGIAVNHHLAHIASAYYTSPYLSSRAISWDGGGDSENFATAHCEGNKINNYQPRQKENIASYWSSLCFSNYRMKRLHDWDPGSGAGKLMGLSAYGTPGDAELVHKLKTTLGEAPHPKNFDPRARSFNKDEDLSDTTTSRSQNVAATLQDYTVKKLISEIKDMPVGEVNLCYAGGLALNCIANREIIKHTQFENLHVPPFPNDTGLAIGAALYVWHHVLDNQKITEYFSPYTGPDYKVGTPDVQRVGELIRKWKIVAYFEGRSESGPRALGHRSIFANPNMPDVRKILNEQVKHREWYRPYAPIVPEEYADDCFVDYNKWSPYMQTSAIIKPTFRGHLAGVNHVDNTTRPQILKKEHNPTLYNIILASGLPAILNTSFNYQEPIVETPEQAMATAEKMPIDALVIGEKIYEYK
jgi:carbamoyltransferase